MWVAGPWLEPDDEYVDADAHYDKLTFVTAVRCVDPKPEVPVDIFRSLSDVELSNLAPVSESEIREALARGMSEREAVITGRPVREPVAPAAGGERVHTCETYGADIVDPSCPGCAPLQQPAERVEPVIIDVSSDVGPEAMAQMDRIIESMGPEIAALMPEHLPAHWDQLTKERDAALATVAKLTAELADERAKHEDLRQRVAQTIDHRNRIEDALEEKLESARAGLDPKACGELIAVVRAELKRPPSMKNVWRNEGEKWVSTTDDALGALDKLAAMLGVKAR